MEGPGIWVTCVKVCFSWSANIGKKLICSCLFQGKEKQTVGELYDLFESVSCVENMSNVSSCLNLL